MTSPARCHAAGPGIQTVPITNCAVTLPEDVIASVLAHYARQAEGASAPASGSRLEYRPESLSVLFGKDPG